jgi:hypothetical protein
VLQYKRAANGKYFPGRGFTKSAKRLITRLNYAFSNSEYSKFFGGRATDTRIRFKLAVRPTAAASAWNQALHTNTITRTQCLVPPCRHS